MMKNTAGAKRRKGRGTDMRRALCLRLRHLATSLASRGIPPCSHVNKGKDEMGKCQAKDEQRQKHWRTDTGACTRGGGDSTLGRPKAWRKLPCQTGARKHTTWAPDSGMVVMCATPSCLRHKFKRFRNCCKTCGVTRGATHDQDCESRLPKRQQITPTEDDPARSNPAHSNQTDGNTPPAHISTTPPPAR